jgi:diadenosine tetraphosphate (Ap4A) HIT family hydrolase
LIKSVKKQHVHVHVVPRASTDFGGHTDQFYQALSHHDGKDGVRLRTPDEMAAEAAAYRPLMTGQ